jgi:hypothetical protein
LGNTAPPHGDQESQPGVGRNQLGGDGHLLDQSVRSQIAAEDAALDAIVYLIAICLLSKTAHTHPSFRR